MLKRISEKTFASSIFPFVHTVLSSCARSPFPLALCVQSPPATLLASSSSSTCCALALRV